MQRRLNLLLLGLVIAGTALAGGIWCVTYTAYPAIQDALHDGDTGEVVDRARELARLLQSGLDSDQVPKEYLPSVKRLIAAARKVSFAQGKVSPAAFGLLSEAFVAFVKADKAQDRWTAYLCPKTGYVWVQSAYDTKVRNPYSGAVGKRIRW